MDLDIVKDADANTTIYLKLIMIDINFGVFSSIHKFLDKLAELAINNDEVKDNVAWALSHLEDYLIQIVIEEDARKLVEKASKILLEDKEILKTKKEIVKYATYINEFHKMGKDKKINEDCLFINNDTINIIAENIDTNVRELTGAYDKVVLYSKMVDKKIGKQKILSII